VKNKGRGTKPNASSGRPPAPIVAGEDGAERFDPKDPRALQLALSSIPRLGSRLARFFAEHGLETLDDAYNLLKEDHSAVFAVGLQKRSVGLGTKAREALARLFFGHGYYIEGLSWSVDANYAERLDRAAALDPLGGMSTGDVVLLLIELLDDDAKVLGFRNALQQSYFENRTGDAAAEALVDIGTAAVDALLTATASRKYIVRARAIYALARINDPRARKTLLRAFEDRTVNVRETAVKWAMGEDDEYVQAYRRALADPAGRVSEYAAQQMRRLNAKRCGVMHLTGDERG